MKNKRKSRKVVTIRFRPGEVFKTHHKRVVQVLFASNAVITVFDSAGNIADWNPADSYTAAALTKWKRVALSELQLAIKCEVDALLGSNTNLHKEIKSFSEDKRIANAVRTLGSTILNEAINRRDDDMYF